MADIAELDIQKKRQYRAELIRTEAMSPAALADYTRTQLMRVGQFAWRIVPYWRKRLAPVFASGRFDAAAWSRVPPLTRAVATSKFGELTAPAAPAFAGATSDGLTSGSTGVPLRYRSSATDGIASAALTERSYDWWRLQPQRTLASIQSFPADWPNLVEGGTRGWRNGTPPGRSLALQITEHVDKQLDWLQRWRPDYLYSRSSQIEALAEAKLRRRLDLSLALVMTIGGPVSQACRELCREAFGAEIFDTYGSSECGHLAAECPDCRLLHVSAEARLIEVVREDNTPCAPGETGRVLVTSYTNFAMPLIRYDIGDYAELGPVQAPCGRPLPSLVRVVGREIETFVRHDGTRFFPTLFGRILQQVMPFKQVQFVQTDYGVVEIRYVAADGNPPIDLAAVQRLVKLRLGEEFGATLVPLDEIPRRPGAKFFYHRCEVPGGTDLLQAIASRADVKRRERAQPYTLQHNGEDGNEIADRAGHRGAAGGAYVIFFRHGSMPDYRQPKVEDCADCPRQRNLNSIGRYQAFLIGEGFRSLGIPVGEVRCVDTARIAFGKGTIAQELRDGNKASAMPRAKFSDKPPVGTNRILVGHGGGGGMLGEEFLREAEAMVVRPLGDGKFELIARVRSEQWAQFEERNRLPPPGAPRAE